MKNLELLISICKKHGIVRKLSSDMYTYGHLGTLLRDNISHQWLADY